VACQVVIILNLVSFRLDCLFIPSRQLSIMNLQNGYIDAGEVLKWHDGRSRWCMRHMGTNFSKQFRTNQLMNMVKKLCG
jgi:hypothetical protein